MWCGPGGRKVADVRHLGGQLIERGQVERHARLVRQREQVQHRVGRAADRHFTGQRIAERRRRQDVARLDVTAQQLHDLHAGVLGQMDARRMHSWVVPLPGSAMPMASDRQFIELAVYMPEHEPQPGMSRTRIP